MPGVQPAQITICMHQLCAKFRHTCMTVLVSKKSGGPKASRPRTVWEVRRTQRCLLGYVAGLHATNTASQSVAVL
eukprot:1422387-Pleurochrysis_carterae.AAC.1